MPAAPQAPDGIEAANVTAWLSERVPTVDPPLSFEPIAGGRSNLTYTVADQAGRRWVLRRPPLHGVLPSAHDMGREHRIVSALGPTDVPVPPVVGLCQDEAVNGAPFYVMEFVEGLVVRDAATAESRLTELARGAASEALVDVLVRLHALEPDAVGLGDLGRKQDYIARQLRRWHGQYEQGRTRQLPLVEEVHARLATSIPDQGPATIVHGDYRLDNLIVGPEGDVRAVLDWELCTLGDPLADVGLLMVYWSEPEDETIPLLSSPTTVAGFPPRDHIAGLYAQRCGRDLSELDYYVAFAFWKLAIVLEGVYARFAAGAYGQTDESFRAFAGMVVELSERAAEAATRAGR